MRKINKFLVGLLILAGAVAFTGHQVAYAASAAKNLAKGISLYEKGETSSAMDYFVNVLMDGDEDQRAQANKYIDLIHKNVGGVQKPVKVDRSFKTGTAQTLADDAADAKAYEQGAELPVYKPDYDGVSVESVERLELFEDNVIPEDGYAIDPEGLLQELSNANRPLTLTEQVEVRRLTAYLRDRSNTTGQTAGTSGVLVDANTPTLRSTAQKDLQNLAEQMNATLEEQQPYIAAKATDTTPAAVPSMAPVSAVTPTVVAAAPAVAAPVEETPVAVQETAAVETVVVEPAAVQAPVVIAAAEEKTEPVVPQQTLTATSGSTFADLTSPEAVEARELYTRQKLQSMTESALAKLRDTPGVHLYMRDGLPDAVDFDDGVLFDGNNFRTETFGALNDLYEVLALTQNARYVILPPGSYTDDVTLAGIKQAINLKSYLVKRGISQGKLYYNMGLVEEEAPAQFNNLKGLSVVFDYDTKLPTRLEKNESNEKAPLLSMAIVPQCHAIDRSLGEAFAIDFSVLETKDAIDNWVLQVVQHGRDGNFYVVRQLEGFAPVYHQILWNGRKGILGPELPCGKYTVVLTGTDVKGKKQTLRRRIVVKCSEQTVTAEATCCANSCGTCATNTCGCGVKAVAVKEGLDYKAARLWSKPGRKMYTKKAEPKAAVKKEAEVVEDNSYTETERITNVVVNDKSAPVTNTSTEVVVGPDDTIQSYETTTTTYGGVETNPYAGTTSY